jgi:UDP-N-acetylglucosamine 2-epimerase (non-hydrolysing)
MDRVLHLVGARPNFMKIAPVMDGLSMRGVDQQLVHTGQHFDREMSDVFLEELGMRRPDYRLGVGPGEVSWQTARILEGVAGVIAETRPALVVVAGDVTSTLAGALAATQAGVPVAHVEAGLRSFDDSMPEEHNRRLVDHLAVLCLTHSESADANLAHEGIASDRVRRVGNTMIDSLLRQLPRARELRPEQRYGLEEGGFVLVTLHRPGVVDNSATLVAAIEALDRLAEQMPVVFPVHPRTRARLDEASIAPRRVRLLEPLSYLEFIGLEAVAAAVVTDSGGIQEETTALGVPCFTFRDNTERPVTFELGTNTVIGTDPAELAHILELPRREGSAIELWDGAAGARAADAIRVQLARRP